MDTASQEQIETNGGDVLNELSIVERTLGAFAERRFRFGGHVGIGRIVYRFYRLTEPASGLPSVAHSVVGVAMNRGPDVRRSESVSPTPTERESRTRHDRLREGSIPCRASQSCCELISRRSGFAASPGREA